MNTSFPSNLRNKAVVFAANTIFLSSKLLSVIVYQEFLSWNYGRLIFLYGNTVHAFCVSLSKLVNPSKSTTVVKNWEMSKIMHHVALMFWVFSTFLFLQCWCARSDDRMCYYRKIINNCVVWCGLHKKLTWDGFSGISTKQYFVKLKWEHIFRILLTWSKWKC